MKDLFSPSSVAVIGVSTHPLNLGKEIARNMLEFGYTGQIHLVGRQGGIIFGHKIYESVHDIADPVDLAVILTPAHTVPGILEQCGRRGVRRAIIESGGFGEYDEQGRSRGDELKRIAERYDMRFIGPNCIGIINASNGLAVPFPALKNVFRKGGVGIIAQSGGVALTLLNMFGSEQLGFSKFAAIGNKLNIDENDLLGYFVDDPEITVICLYLESIQDGRRLTDIGRRSGKPIVVHKANVSSLSGGIAQSHTEALANDDRVVDAALHQAGIVRFRATHSYLDFVNVLQLPEIKGRNLGIVSRSGGHAVIAADAAHFHGFQLPPFGEDFLAEIRKHLRADVIRLANPLDLGDLFDFDVYMRIVEHTLQQDTIDGILFLHTYFAAVEGESSRKLLHAVASLSQKYHKPCALCVYTEQSELSRLHKELEFPIFRSPERAIHALDLSVTYHQRRAFIACNQSLATPDPEPDRHSIRRLLDRIVEQNRAPLLHESIEMISHAGLKVPEHCVVDDADAAVSHLSTTPGPYAVKVISEAVSHKSDRGGVILGLPDVTAVRAAFDEMTQRFGSPAGAGMHGVLVQTMVPRVPGSYELIVGGKKDPHFGPTVMVGHGGIFVEVFGKTSIRMAPLSLAEVDEMIDELPGSEILKGVRGLPAIDRDALRDAILRVADLMVNFPEIDQLDVNPIVVSNSGATAVDARVFLRP